MNKVSKGAWQDYLDDSVPTRQLLARSRARARRQQNRWRALSWRQARALGRKRVKLV